MTASDSSLSDRAGHGLPFHEFVALMASLMAVNALGVDAMLPALGRIGADLGVAVENHQQLVIVAYIGAFGIGQLFYGPLADRYGRRPVLLASMAIYAAMSFIAAHAASFELLLAARAFQGFSAAASRVLSISIIRDCYAGRRLARVMSLAFMTFLIVPIAAPTVGQIILLVAPWQWIFYLLGGFSLFVALWAWLRLPETLAADRRLSIHPRNIGRAAMQTLRDRCSLGYTLAGGMLFGCLLGFLSSSRQIFDTRFGAPEFFATGFALAAGGMAVAALLNSRIVERLGMRVVSHGALLAMILLCLVRVAIVLSGHETLWLFVVMQVVTMFFFGLTGSNFGAMAMEPMGSIAGTASSVQGCISNGVATMIGLAIGQSFAGTTLPLTLGYLLSTMTALGIVLIVEGGRLFRPHNAAPSAHAA